MKNWLGITWTDRMGRSKVPLGRSRLFWTGVAIKLILSLCFASDFLRIQFAPFAEQFISSGLQNPYDWFVQHGKGTEFPYPPLMLWLFSLPALLLSPLTGSDPATFGIWESLVFRIPLFVADLAILLVLLRWLKTRIRQVLVWYWLSPVLIYINYFHGQLDAIPIALLFISLYLLFKGRMFAAYALLAASVACKTNMVVVLPFFLLYHFRQNKDVLKGPLAGFGLFMVVVLLFNLPYLGSDGFITMVYNNPVQTQVFDLFYQFNKSLRIYFIPSVFFVLVLWYYTLRFVNRDQLTLFLAFGFLALTLMVAPMQGWYYWIMPLLIYFVIRQGQRERQVLVVLSLLYFIYFGLVPNPDYFNSSNFEIINRMTAGLADIKPGEKALNIAFTLLQTTLLLTGVLVYRKGISNNIQAKFLSQPYLVGIGGDSAAGKSTLSDALQAVFEQENTSIIRGDDMHKWERGNENWKQFTHLNPKANNLHEELDQARSLKVGKEIRRREYNHNTGTFTLPNNVRPNKLIIFEGLHSFYLKDQAEIYDLKIFMEPDENLRVWWKVNRDVKKRNYTPEQVLEQLNKREEDSVKYIRSQRDKADIIASFYSRKALTPGDTNVEPELALRITMEDKINPGPLLGHISGYPGIEVDYHYQDNRLILDFKAETIHRDWIENIGFSLFPELEEIGIYEPNWKEGYAGLLQLVTVYVIFKKLSYDA